MNDYQKYQIVQTVNAVLGWASFVIAGGVILAIILASVGCKTMTSNKNDMGTRLVARACPDTEIETHTPEAWSKADQAAYLTASDRCAQLYQYSPCLKKFIRVAQYQYWAICGANPTLMFDFSTDPNN